MDKQEKVMKGLGCCSQGAKEPYTPTIRYCAECPYLKSKIPCTRALARDALELLKEQEAQKVKNIVGTAVSAMGDCPICGVQLHTAFIPGQIKTRFCYNCGQAVKWE